MLDLIKRFADDFPNLWAATVETLVMSGVAGLITLIIGVPLGSLLYATQKNGLLARPKFYQIISAVVNIVRSFPFFILMVAMIPLTRVIVGTSIGTAAAIVPLTVSAIPFYARMVEGALNEIPKGMVEAGYTMGCTRLQIIYRVLWPESFVGIVNAFIITLIALIGYSAMAGAIGGGGLGALAFNRGYQAFDTELMILTVVMLIIIVQLIQLIGDAIVAYFSRRR